MILKRITNTNDLFKSSWYILLLICILRHNNVMCIIAIIHDPQNYSKLLYSGSIWCIIITYIIGSQCAIPTVQLTCYAKVHKRNVNASAAHFPRLINHYNIIDRCTRWLRTHNDIMLFM